MLKEAYAVFNLPLSSASVSGSWSTGLWRIPARSLSCRSTSARRWRAQAAAGLKACPGHQMIYVCVRMCAYVCVFVCIYVRVDHSCSYSRCSQSSPIRDEESAPARYKPFSSSWFFFLVFFSPSVHSALHLPSCTHFTALLHLVCPAFVSSNLPLQLWT